jgi:hypothetical protein
MMENNYEDFEVTLHMSGDGSAKDVAVRLGDLDDDQLKVLYNTGGVDEARFVLRERTGSDPAVTFRNMTPEDMKWFGDWTRRNPEKFADMQARQEEILKAENDRP